MTDSTDGTAATATMDRIHENQSQAMSTESSNNPKRETSVTSAKTAEEDKAPRQLSTVSALYDVGHKGYLTPAEESARRMDQENKGYLSNEQVASLKEETQALRQANRLLQHWIMGLALTVLILGISNIVMSIVAARLAQDTSVSDESGLMTVKDHENVPVMTVGTSQRYNFVFRSEQDRCVSARLLATMFSQTVEGVGIT
uniref:Uncharacterized protein n=1 Tax=Entomoneis paludosa TaxID=265537 RepID=A0A7S3DU96_9STRA|mmetsp:Transcript_38149/g.79331  ORF Transcript_38149/g.79331 Transcript_38149/m.79331 type:complete len:201 (+) Transcript_38149:118-720(+)